MVFAISEPSQTEIGDMSNGVLASILHLFWPRARTLPPQRGLLRIVRVLTIHCIAERGPYSRLLSVKCGESSGRSEALSPSPTRKRSSTVASTGQAFLVSP